MYSILLPVMVCTAGVVVAALILLVIIVLRPVHRASQAEEGKPARRSARKQPISWLLFIPLALIVAVGSVPAALFLVVGVWLLQLNPKREWSNVVKADEKQECEKNYKWLRNSSFITIPIMLFILLIDSQPVGAVLISFVVNLGLIGRLQSNNLYVFRQTQQTLFLLVVRAATATLIFSLFYLDEGFWPFLLINGSLWLFGTNWIVSQVKRNECWLMRRRGETILVPDPQIDTGPEMDRELAEFIKSIEAKDKQSAYEKSLKAFRTGTPETKKKAVLILSKLGEVEKF